MSDRMALAVLAAVAFPGSVRALKRDGGEDRGDRG